MILPAPALLSVCAAEPTRICRCRLLTAHVLPPCAVQSPRLDLEDVYTEEEEAAGREWEERVANAPELSFEGFRELIPNMREHGASKLADT